MAFASRGIKTLLIRLNGKGESYAGRYVPYIGAQMLDAKDTEYFDLSGTFSKSDRNSTHANLGALMYDPCIGDCSYVQSVFPTYYFLLNNNEILNLDDDTLEAVRQLSETCGYNAVRPLTMTLTTRKHKVLLSTPG